MASQAANSSKKVQEKVKMALENLITETQHDKSGFFVSKDDSVDSLQMSWALLKAVETFNRNTEANKIEGLQYDKLAAYFTLKASLADCLCQLDTALRGL